MKSSNNFVIPDDLIQIGTIIGAHGVGGAVKVYSYAESPDLFKTSGELTLIDQAGNLQLCQVLRASAHKHIVRLTLAGVATREQAEAIAKRAICIEKRKLPPLEPDTHYWIDLIGMSVYSLTGEYLGRIEEIIPTGANDVYVVKTPAGHPAKEILIPAIASVIQEVDVQNRCMRVALPEGLIDL